MKTKLIFILTALFGISGCDKLSTSGLSGSVDRSGKPIATTVYFYDNIEDVRKKYREIHNLPHSEPVNVSGFARWAEYKDKDGKTVPDSQNEVQTCQIYTLRPTKVNDEATSTLGHEMLHCVLGTYHPEGMH